MQAQNPDGALVLQLSGALLPILATSAGAGRKHMRGDEAATLRVLGALAAIWSRAAENGTPGGAHMHLVNNQLHVLGPVTECPSYS